MSPPRVVIIGAGIGGLSAAIDLASRGASVSVVERQPVAGGKMREIDVDGASVDSGPTVFTMRWVFDELFKAAGTEFSERVPLSRADRLARHSWLDGSQLDLYADVERSAEAVSELAGRQEGDAYRRFAASAESMFATLDHSFMRRERPGPVGLTLSLGLAGVPRLAATRPFTSMWAELGRIFSDPRLRQLFGRYATYCGSSPFSAPATLMLIAHAERAGVWLVDGGMQRLAENMAALAKEKGAVFRYGESVAAITTTNNRVTGVALADGTTIEADAVVFNGDVAALGSGLLGEGVTTAIQPRRDEPRSLSAITWSMRASVRGFPLDHHTVFFGGDYAREFSSIFDDGRITDEPTVYVCAQDRGHGRASANGESERLLLLINAPPRPVATEEVEENASRVFALLERHGVELSDTGTPVVSTPGDYADRFPGSGGAIYGWPTHGWSGSFKRHGSRSRVRGLYLAGGTVHPGPGVPMTAISGRLAARSLADDLKL